MFSFSLDDFLNLGFVIVGLVAFIITFCKTSSISKSIKNLNEVLKMRDTSKYVQDFSVLKEDYILNKASNELEKLPTEINIQDKIQSYIDVALDRALEKFMPECVDDDSVTDYASRVNDLASLGEAIELAENYREAYNLPDNYSISDIYSFVDQEAKTLKNKISNKGVKKDETLPEEKK